MNTLRIGSPRRLVGLALVGMLAMVGYGYAATNTVDPSNAGDGVGAVSGYTISNIHYGLDSNTPSNLASIEFDTNPVLPSNGSVRVSVDDGASWLPSGDCSVSGATVTCGVTTTVAVEDVTLLRVVAAQ